MKLLQLHFRPESKRGPLSSVLFEDEDGSRDILTVFWNALRKDPQNEDEAETLLESMARDVIRVAKDPNVRHVAKGVFNDPTRKPEVQKMKIRRIAERVGWDPPRQRRTIEL